jgi:tetratricopeptide (TPR) repeat protein
MNWTLSIASTQQVAERQMNPENREPGLGSECGTECGGMPSAVEPGYAKEPGSVEPAMAASEAVSVGSALSANQAASEGAAMSANEAASVEPAMAATEAASIEPAMSANVSTERTNSIHFADAAVGIGSHQKLRVSDESTVGAEIAILSEDLEKGAENSASTRHATNIENKTDNKAENKTEYRKHAQPVSPELPHTHVPRWVPGFDSGLNGSNRFKTADSRSKQLFNALYFGLAGAACLSLTVTYSTHLPGWPTSLIGPVGLGLWGTFFALALCACYFAINNRPHESDFQVDLMPHVRRRIRRIGLLLPLPLILLAGSVQLSQHELAIAQHRIDDGRYHRAIRHLTLAIGLNPFNERALAQMALCQNWLYQYKPALEFANRALQLNPDDARALADKAWALNRLENFKEALPPALRAAQLDPNNGEAFSALADAYLGVGDNNAALVAASKHVELHSGEAAAYEQLGDVYEKLGQPDQAAVNRDEAKALRDADGNED